MIKRNLPAVVQILEARKTAKESNKGRHIETQPVLGGAYANKRLKEQNLLTHSVDVATGKALCRKVKDENLAGPDSGYNDPPTCPECLKRDPRF